MKVGNSTVQFNTSINYHQLGRRNPEDYPYWALYAREGDCIGSDWKSLRNLTYNEVIEYLTNYKGHRVLEAFPRLTKTTRHTLSYKFNGFEFIVIDKWTGEVLLVYDDFQNEITLMSPDYKTRPAHLLSKLYQKSPHGKIYTQFAVSLIREYANRNNK